MFRFDKYALSIFEINDMKLVIGNDDAVPCSKSLRHITGKIKFLLNENHRIFAGLFASSYCSMTNSPHKHRCILPFHLSCNQKQDACFASLRTSSAYAHIEHVPQFLPLPLPMWCFQTLTPVLQMVCSSTICADQKRIILRTFRSASLLCL